MEKKDLNKGFVRIRNENGNITLTTKILNDKYPEEYETIVNSSYDDIKNILTKSGFTLKIEIIKFREKWTFPGCNELVFDLWPGLPIVLEVDCLSENLLKKSCKKIGLNVKDGLIDANKYNYLYGFEKHFTQNIPNLNFKNFKKLFKNHILKNKNIFEKLNKKYYLSFLDSDKKKYSKYF